MDSVKGFIERRKFQRILIEGIAEVTWNGQSFSGKIRDISLLGAMVEVSAAIPVGDSIGLCIHIAAVHDVVVTVEAVVARTEVAGFGVRFTAIDLLSLAHLKDLFAFNSMSVDTMIEEYLKTFATGADSRFQRKGDFL